MLTDQMLSLALVCYGIVEQKEEAVCRRRWEEMGCWVGAGSSRPPVKRLRHIWGISTAGEVDRYSQGIADGRRRLLMVV